MEVYENFMNTAKLVWEEFTGSGNQPNKNPVVKVPERAKSNVVLRQKRKRPSSAFPQNRIQKFSTWLPIYYIDRVIIQDKPVVKEEPLPPRPKEDLIIKKDKLVYQPAIINLMPSKMPKGKKSSCIIRSNSNIKSSYHNRVF